MTDLNTSHIKMNYAKESDWLWPAFNLEMKSIMDLMKDSFYDTIFAKEYYERKWKYPTNYWDIDVIDKELAKMYWSWHLELTAFKKANEEYKWWNYQYALVCSWKYYNRFNYKKWNLDLLLDGNRIDVYKSFYKHYWLLDDKLNGEKRDKESYEKYMLSIKEFLSCISYNSYNIAEDGTIEFYITLDWKKYQYTTIQPVLNLFLWLLRNGYSEYLSPEDIKKYILDDYVYWDGIKWTNKNILKYAEKHNIKIRKS